MARQTNQNRMLHSRLVVIAAFVLAFITKQIAPHDTLLHESVDFLGYALVVLCGLGRLYTTAFLGGHKNRTLITYGPFSLVRNPLYLFSWLGFTGVALLSMNLWVMVLVPSMFLVIFRRLVGREERLLGEVFGADYAAYLERVPRFVPRSLHQEMPLEMPVVPRHLWHGLQDASVWFVAPPLVEFLEHMLN